MTFFELCRSVRPRSVLLAGFLALTGAGIEKGLAVEAVEADICVYGATSGGVTAAAQAARMGKKVVLVGPDRHLGGMTSSGLGWTDFGNKATIGGLSRDFYSRIARKYNSSSAQLYTFEPKVAEEVFNDIVEESGVPVYLDERLASVQMTGNRIASIIMESGDVFRAKMFIDCTYEGDLMARAGVSYTVGREPNSQYGETLNGIQTSHGNDLPSGIDPYVVAGNPSSGLLFGVNAAAGGPNGSGDALVQAYNYRLCLTNRASNRVRIVKPSDYRESDYELLFRAIAAGQTSGFLKNSGIGNSKTDTNNNGGISTNFISGLSGEWAEASYERRKEIAKAHELWIRGFIWTLQNSQRVSSSIRNMYADWGLAADEFTDNDNWPYQIYVREARRMVSDYVMTELNCVGTRVAPEPIALASYRMDSHSTQRYVSDGMVKTEGNVSIIPIEPYPIAYRSIVPKVGECENLLVTFALSASHMGFASCRMEPVLMMLGQSAATAAAFAIDDRASVQDVSFPKLQAQLRADGQILSWNTPPVGSGMTIDSSDSSNVTINGSWNSSNSTDGYYGSDYLHDNNTGKGAKSVKYQPLLSAPGTYEILARWSAASNRATNVPIDIVTASGMTTVTVDQRQQGGTWVSLGSHNLSPGRGSVTIRTTNTDGYVIADAVHFSSAVPRVTLWATNSSAKEPSADWPEATSGLLTAARDGPVTHPLTVRLTFGGTAVNGTDYSPVSAAVIIPSGSASATISLAPLSDMIVEGDETVAIEVATDAAYEVDEALRSAIISIQDSSPIPEPTPTTPEATPTPEPTPELTPTPRTTPTPEPLDHLTTWGTRTLIRSVGDEYLITLKVRDVDGIKRLHARVKGKTYRVTRKGTKWSTRVPKGTRKIMFILVDNARRRSIEVVRVGPRRRKQIERAGARRIKVMKLEPTACSFTPAHC